PLGASEGLADVAPAGLFGQLPAEPAGPSDADLDLLELNAAEAGQPAEIPASEAPPEAEPGESLDVAGIEEVPEPATVEVEETSEGEGPGADFEALLGSSHGLAPRAQEQRSTEDAALLPADGEVKLLAQNGPRPGAEFSGRSTLASAGGLYCLIESFDLPAGTRMNVVLTSPRGDHRLEVDDATVSRVRRAPGNATEVQLAFDRPSAAFENFVAQHFGEKPVGFALFGRRRKR
ncbi:MAG TPA: hypothetical protein VF157_14970, partial [Chloroflexota bacterium]